MAFRNSRQTMYPVPNIYLFLLLIVVTTQTLDHRALSPIQSADTSFLTDMEFLDQFEFPDVASAQRYRYYISHVGKI